MNDIDLLTLNSVQGLRILGAAANERIGYSVSSAGDINGDGMNDVIIGTYQTVGDIALSRAAYVIYGKNSGLTDIDVSNISAAQGFKILGANVNDTVGYSVGSAGDINGDGFNDVIVGVCGASDSRTAYVIYGKSSGNTIDLASFTVAQGFQIIGATYSDNGSRLVNSGGDINGDGINDVIVGAAQMDPSGRNGAGTAYVIYGKSSSLTNIDLANFTSTQGFKILGAAAGDNAGYSVSSAGDINGDGVNDVIVGAWKASPGDKYQAGMAYVIYGRKSILGTPGNDVICGSLKLEDIDGLAGIDTICYANSSFGVVVNLATNSVSGGDAQGDTICNFENIIGSANDDILTGDAGSNNIQGGAGNDLIEGMAGADVLDGGSGTDTVSYASSAGAVAVSLATGTGSGGDASGDIISNFENIIGSNFTDTLTGDANANNIQGGAGDDIIEGRAGADMLDGGAGTDTLNYTSSAASVTVNLATNTVSGGDAAGDTIYNFENIIGSNFADILTGNDNANNIRGGAGDDIIEGMAGADTLDGEAGADTLSYASSAGAVTVSLATNTASGGDATGDIIINFKNIIGSAYADILTGMWAPTLSRVAQAMM